MRADLAAEAGITEAVEVAQKGRTVFTVLSGGHNRYKTGSHIDQDSANLLLGATTQHANQTGTLSLGASSWKGAGAAMTATTVLQACPACAPTAAPTMWGWVFWRSRTSATACTCRTAPAWGA